IEFFTIDCYFNVGWSDEMLHTGQHRARTSNKGQRSGEDADETKERTMRFAFTAVMAPAQRRGETGKVIQNDVSVNTKQQSVTGTRIGVVAGSVCHHHLIYLKHIHVINKSTTFGCSLISLPKSKPAPRSSNPYLHTSFEHTVGFNPTYAKGSPQAIQFL